MEDPRTAAQIKAGMTHADWYDQKIKQMKKEAREEERERERERVRSDYYDKEASGESTQKQKASEPRLKIEDTLIGTVPTPEPGVKK